ncbi:hypothetical protein [Bacillus spizizenii]|uniref:hypothetical protein n=1 Tax=Bacillus spizizenii TaxID=96241 RepID=UPI002FCC0C7A
MISPSDIEWMLSNRDDITDGRSEVIQIFRTVEADKHPITGEPVVEEIPEDCTVVWKEFSSVAIGERSVLGGVELRKGDVKVSFPYDVDLTDVTHAVRGGIAFELVTLDEKGIGRKNRTESIARRRT